MSRIQRDGPLPSANMQRSTAAGTLIGDDFPMLLATGGPSFTGAAHDPELRPTGQLVEHCMQSCSDQRQAQSAVETAQYVFRVELPPPQSTRQLIDTREPRPVPTTPCRFEPEPSLPALPSPPVPCVPQPLHAIRGSKAAQELVLSPLSLNEPNAGAETVPGSLVPALVVGQVEPPHPILPPLPLRLGAPPPPRSNEGTPSPTLTLSDDAPNCVRILPETPLLCGNGANSTPSAPSRGFASKAATGPLPAPAPITDWDGRGDRLFDLTGWARGLLSYRAASTLDANPVDQALRTRTYWSDGADKGATIAPRLTLDMGQARRATTPGHPIALAMRATEGKGTLGKDVESVGNGTSVDAPPAAEPVQPRQVLLVVREDTAVLYVRDYFAPTVGLEMMVEQVRKQLLIKSRCVLRVVVNGQWQATDEPRRGSDGS